MHFFAGFTIALLGSIAGAQVEHHGRFTFREMPTELSGPCDVTEGPDGNVWIEELTANKMAVFNVKTRKLTDYPIPFTEPRTPISGPKIPGTERAFLSCALRTGFDKYLYASNGLRNQLVRVNVTSKKIDVFTPPDIAGNLQPLNDVTTAPDGVYFTQTTANVITHFDYHTHKFRNIEIPTKASVPVGIFYASDGGIWFLEFGANKVGRLDRKTGKIQEYPVGAKLAGPIVMRAETDNRYLYFASTIGNSIGRIDMKTRRLKAYPVPTPFSTPVENCPSRNGDIWFTHILKNSLGRLRPSTGEFIEVNLPNATAPESPIGSPPFVGSGLFCRPENAVWFTELLPNKLGRYQLR